MTEVEIAYGMTETSPVSFQTRVDAPFEKRVSTVGSVHPHVEVKIINSETQEISPVGEMGELCIRGYSVMLGYWNNPEASSAHFKVPRYIRLTDEFPMTITGKVQRCKGAKVQRCKSIKCVKLALRN